MKTRNFENLTLVLKIEGQMVSICMFCLYSLICQLSNSVCTAALFVFVPEVLDLNEKNGNTAICVPCRWS